MWHPVFQTRNDVINAIGEYIDGLSNPLRRHSALGYKSPIQFETVNRKLVSETLH
nr:IS3 family transposase [Ochrobactrum chromiisoli]